MKGHIAIAGATGLVGRALHSHLTKLQYQVTIIKRSDFSLSSTGLAAKIERCDCVINLCGAPILQRWSAKAKKEILQSRVSTTTKLVNAISVAKEKLDRLKLFINASAIGIYEKEGMHTETHYVEDADFVADVVREWESEVVFPEEKNMRSVILRLGVVLSKDGGYMKKISPIFSKGLGGIVGSGDQILSFIHIADLCRIFQYAIQDENVQGIYNATAPMPSCNKHFTTTYSHLLGKPAMIPVPSFAIKLLFGEASAIILKGSTVLPERLIQSGFAFTYPNIEKALESIVDKRK